MSQVISILITFVVDEYLYGVKIETEKEKSRKMSLKLFLNFSKNNKKGHIKLLAKFLIKIRLYHLQNNSKFHIPGLKY